MTASASAHTGPVSSALADLVARSHLDPDPAQQEAAAILDGIAAALEAPRPGGLFARLRRPAPIIGAYLKGDVGRGKTLLMDLFYETVGIAEKRRIHFHEFMDEIHERITAFRKTEQGQKADADPVAAAARPVIATTRLLCLDEFQVTDITNAMLLGRLFSRLFDAGIVVVATSNVAPDDLYRDGLNRQLILPFIDLLKSRTRLVALDGPTDYRRLKLEGQSVYHFGTGPEAEAAMDALFARVTGGAEGRPATLTSLGRTIDIPMAAMGTARFPFAALCERPLGARDYLKIANGFDMIVIDGVPQFSATRSDAAKRFILLVDTLYDRGVKLGASFPVPLDALGADERTRFEFARCVSRLIEMQSDAYLSAPKKPGMAA
ncbi:cell division protein ZapE [Arsenicitalea aurantiaca]|uniref:cell division protein ZapE n=1 Tax=Arsenicitalea aurantiaca TaxID=1783274 RepID=UPI0013155A95|nr:cell division protein ZapE [Arsenicitalea aurantiaca]